MDLELERTRLLERDAEWAALSSEGQDVERILSFWTDDARVYAPGLAVFSGKAALRRYLEGALAIPGFHITWTTAAADPSPDGELAYLSKHQHGHCAWAAGAATHDQRSHRNCMAP